MFREKNMQVGVVGGGVAGTASAIALRRLGIDVTVHEAYEDPAGPVGSFVSLAANGLRCLELLDCLEPVLQAGFPVRRQRMWSGNGKLLGDVPRARLADDSRPSVTVRRADLVAALRAEAVRSGARILTGRRVTSRPEGVDLVVGADGIWSTTRAAVDPTAPEPRYADTYTVSGTSVGVDLPIDSFNIIFARRGAFLHVTAPDGSTWWSAQVSSPTAPDPHKVTTDELLAAFATEPQALAILHAADGPRTGTLHHALPPLTTTHRDRTVLIGDAAHPVGAGQGASMAMEDAIVLAQQLRGAPPIEDALAGFDRARRARVGKMVKAAASNRDAKTAGRFAAGMRDLVMPIVFPRVYPKATSWLYTYDPGPLTTEPEAAVPGTANHRAVNDVIPAPRP
jgi:salicylate hydroxylase